MTKLARTIAIAFVMGLVLVVTCLAIPRLNSMTSRAITFTVVEEGYSLGRTKDIPDPLLIIMASSGDLILPTGLTLGEELAAKISSIDLHQYFLLFVWRPRSPNRPIVEKITRQQDNIIVTLRDGVAMPGNYVLPEWTQPYEIVQVDKAGNWNRNIHFVLKYETQGVFVEKTHFIP
jgi:hypothetical protein